MPTVAVDSSTVRIAVSSAQELQRLVESYPDYIAVIHQGQDRYLLVYDATALVQSVVDVCVVDRPCWRPGRSHARF